jgi:hypothetical protein
MANSRIKVVFGNERIITPSGLGIVGGMLGKSNFRKHCDRQKVDPKRSQPQIKNGDILLTYIGILHWGKQISKPSGNSMTILTITRKRSV